MNNRYGFIWPSGCRGEYISISTNQKRELHVAGIFVNESGRNGHPSQRTFHIFFLPCMGSFGKEFSEERIFFTTQPIRNKNGLQLPCLLTDRSEKNNLHRAPYIYATYQVSVQVILQFQRRILFQKSANQKKIIVCDGHVC